MSGVVRRHENTIYQQIFPAQAPARLAAPREKKGGSTTSSAATADAATLPSSYSFDYLFAPAAKTEDIYEDTVKVCPDIFQRSELYAQVG